MPENENSYDKVLQEFVDKLPTNDDNISNTGIELRTVFQGNVFYVYKNSNGTIYTKPTNGTAQFR